MQSCKAQRHIPPPQHVPLFHQSSLSQSTQPRLCCQSPLPARLQQRHHEADGVCSRTWRPSRFSSTTDHSWRRFNSRLVFPSYPRARLLLAQGAAASGIPRGHEKQGDPTGTCSGHRAVRGGAHLEGATSSLHALSLGADPMVPTGQGGHQRPHYLAAEQTHLPAAQLPHHPASTPPGRPRHTDSTGTRRPAHVGHAGSRSSQRRQTTFSCYGVLTGRVMSHHCRSSGFEL